MTPEQNKVLEFHRAMGSTIGSAPAIRDAELRMDLIMEEALEFAEAMGWSHQMTVRKSIGPSDLIAAADALGDLLYVVYGAAVAFGIDLEPIFNEIHRSNMTKIGGPVREDGKVLKPATYEQPRLEPIIRAQIILSEIEQDRRNAQEWLQSLPGSLATPEEMAEFYFNRSDFELEAEYEDFMHGKDGL